MSSRRQQRVILLPGLPQCLLVGQSGIGRSGGEVFAGPLRVFEEWSQVEQQPYATDPCAEISNEHWVVRQ